MREKERGGGGEKEQENGELSPLHDCDEHWIGRERERER